MDRSDVINLIAVKKTQDSRGVWRESETARQVFCQVRSVSQSEFFDAGRNGLNPAYQFTVFAGDYKGEDIVQFHGSRYAVYRTYLARTDDLELYVQREGGTNGNSR